MRKLTPEYLVKLGACHDQVVLFRQVFPSGASITKTSLAKAARAGLSWSWLVGTLKGAALAEYQRIEGPALAEYERIKGAALLTALKLLED